MIATAIHTAWGSGLDEVSEGAGSGARRPAGGTTSELLALARGGDGAALDKLCVRYRRPMLRWAHGRLPRWARERVATEDVVQETLVALCRRVPGLVTDGPGSLEAYLRVALDNRLKDEVRRARRRPVAEAEMEDQPDDGPSPLEEAIGRERLASYENALASLEPEVKGLVIARLELEMSYAAIAEAFGRPSADAARMAVSRALVRVAEEMARHG